ncbi:MAG: hypothetical protein H6704_07715 [Myxococcales bacterium]|nr:hypothetical protein [Myxococcales bacterium]
MASCRCLVADGELLERLYRVRAVLEDYVEAQGGPPSDFRREWRCVEALLGAPLVEGAEPPQVALESGTAIDLAQTLLSLLVEAQNL